MRFEQKCVTGHTPTNTNITHEILTHICFASLTQQKNVKCKKQHNDSASLGRDIMARVFVSL